MSVNGMKARFREAPDRTMISVHRAAWGPAPENSIPAIQGALDFDVIEVDVQLDADNRAFLMHDDTFERMCGNSALSGGTSTELLTSLRLKAGGGGSDAALTDEHIPLLGEAFEALGNSDAIFDLDVKHARDIEAVSSQVAAFGGQGRATLKIDVATPDDIKTLKALEGQFDIMVIAKPVLRTVADLEIIQALHAADQAAIEVWFGDLDLLTQACAISGKTLRVATYTLADVHCCGLSDAKALADPDAVWGTLIKAGVREILSDCFAELSDWLANQKV